MAIRKATERELASLWKVGRTTVTKHGPALKLLPGSPLNPSEPIIVGIRSSAEKWLDNSSCDGAFVFTLNGFVCEAMQCGEVFKLEDDQQQWITRRW